jgi:hypothetical protein
MFSNKLAEVKKFLPAILVIALVIAGLSFWSAKTDGNCVTVSIDYGVLDSQNQNYEKCLSASGDVTALDLMNTANFKIEGTEKYGDQIVCRLNNLPKPNQPIGVKGHEDYIETCKDMPAEFAYWAVFEKRKQAIPNPADLNTKWTYAQVGVAELTLNAGDSLAFVFTDNGNVKYPK